jgi:hypothetical protein
MTDQPFFIPSLLLSALAFPLVLGMVPRNRWYGVRTAQTLADETLGVAPTGSRDGLSCFLP